MESSSLVLQAEDIIKSFPSELKVQPLSVLEGVNLEVHSASIVSVVGSSGCGKSTLLHILGGLDHPNSGQVYWDGNLITSMNQEKLATLRNREVGFVFQFHHLLPEFTALENIMIPMMIQDIGPAKSKERAQQLLDRFGILNRAQHRPPQLSGGEQQRVSLARALANKPRLILADEPTGNLDEGNTENILELLFNLREDEGVSIVLVTHEDDIANRCDITYELSHGVLHTAENSK